MMIQEQVEFTFPIPGQRPFEETIVNAIAGVFLVNLVLFFLALPILEKCRNRKPVSSAQWHFAKFGISVQCTSCLFFLSLFLLELFRNPGEVISDSFFIPIMLFTLAPCFFGTGLWFYILRKGTADSPFVSITKRDGQ